MSKIVKFEGHNYFRQRLVLATLSGKILKIEKIRSNDANPGLRDFEASFLRLLEKVTNGATIEISYTGTSIVYKPGVIVGGKVYHDCGTSRAVGYFLEPLIALGPFSKAPMNVTLNGITNDNVDISVDTIRTVLLPQLKKFGIEEGLELDIPSRGAPPNGGGKVIFRCPIVRSLKPVQFTDEGRIKRIRGVAYCTRVAPQFSNRMVDSARGVLDYVNDINIAAVHYQGDKSGLSPGFAISLLAKTTTSAFYSAELAGGPGQTPEDIGLQAARMLLSEIRKGGCVDSISQTLVLLMMVLGPNDVSKVRVGDLTPFTIQYMRDLQDFFGSTFKITQETDKDKTVLGAAPDTLVMTCVGIGYVNTNKKTT
ncbi:RNA 3'-terminal phosphate cyclase domain-containing protein [Gamsiella multidivaricata]|uniref:RNA 3'-terminal phosphate cyclase domain-containing protein n=1 Tax=Gamsiella multidivaricata TaxID=101098 RepID=UPI00221FDC4C|nr:RNA 3'-terminal phosphate cyclase domain-containing protein [Gamsiella multidivaricata]KAG0364072.1 rRNA-processing endoribonuclease [Gamsiella multidivaricata]KAI7823809.1 RNA 3'-terminal phosphate cyclase domain-containing protein [Gamsiella multidivaricata]